MKPICVPCRRFYRMKQGGFYFIEAMPKPGHDRPAPGNAMPEAWTPYKVWAGDLWHCPDCGHELVSGTGHHPVAEHYQPDFDAVVVRLDAGQFQVNDC